jgi:hypothetical protein
MLLNKCSLTGRLSMKERAFQNGGYAAAFSSASLEGNCIPEYQGQNVDWRDGVEGGADCRATIRQRRKASCTSVVAIRSEAQSTDQLSWRVALAVNIFLTRKG